MNRMILLAGIAAIPLAGCTTDQQGMPLIFARAQNVGVSVAASVPDQGAHLTIGFADRNVAIVPTNAPGSGGPIRSTAVGQYGQFQDSLSVLGQFEVNAKGSASVEAGLGTFFATGIAARNLAEGFRDRLAGKASAPAAAPAAPAAPPPGGGN